MKTFLIGITVLFLGTGCALLSPYTAIPERPLIDSEIIYFRSLVQVSLPENSARSSSFEITGFWSPREQLFILQGYLPPPTFKNLFSLIIAQDSMFLRDEMNREKRVYLFDEDVRDEYHAYIDLLGYALYSKTGSASRLRTRWREHNGLASMRLRRIPFVRRVQYYYIFEGADLKKTNMVFPRGAEMNLHFLHHEKRTEMPDLERWISSSESGHISVYQIDSNNFNQFVREMVHAVDRAM